MDNFTFYSPTYFVFGKETEKETGKYVKKYGGTKVLIHYGGGSAVRSGLIARIEASLDAEGIGYVELGGVKASPHADLIYKGIDFAKKEKVDFILAVGGGSVMDSAKGIALGVPYDGDFWDFYCGKKGPVTEALPVGCVVTIAASGSEGSTDSVVTLDTEDGHEYKRCADGDILRPLFAIMNPELMMTLPPYQTASGISDIMAHCMERYFSHTKECELTDRLLEAVMLTMIKEARRVMKDPMNYDARANIMWAAMVAQNRCRPRPGLGHPPHGQRNWHPLWSQPRCRSCPSLPVLDDVCHEDPGANSLCQIRKPRLGHSHGLRTSGTDCHGRHQSLPALCQRRPGHADHHQ